MSEATATLDGVARPTPPRAVRLVPRACAAAIKQEILAAASFEGTAACTAEQMVFQRPLPLLGLALLTLPAIACAQAQPTSMTDARATVGASAPASAQIDPRWQEALARINVADDDWGLQAKEWTDASAVEFDRTADRMADRTATARIVADLLSKKQSPPQAQPGGSFADISAATFESIFASASISTDGSASADASAAFLAAAFDVSVDIGNFSADIQAISGSAASIPALSVDTDAERSRAMAADARQMQAGGAPAAHVVEPYLDEAYASAPDLPQPNSPGPSSPQLPVGLEPNSAALRRRFAIETQETLGPALLEQLSTMVSPASRIAPLCEEPQHAPEVADAPQASGALPTDAPLLDAIAGTASSLQLRAYRYIPSVTEYEEVQQRPPDEQRLMDLNRDGEYPRLAREGKKFIEKRGKDGQTIDDQLRLVIANALAWSGQLQAAERQYRQLDSGAFALDAKVAMANILHWRGKDDQALPLYQEVLASMPHHADALNAIARSEASLRPRTRIGLQGSRDSDDVLVRTLNLNHIMRTHDAKRVWEFDLYAMRGKSPFAKDLQSGLNVRHQRLDWRTRPTFELGLADKLYASVSLTPSKWPLVVSAGRVNWAHISFNPRALQRGLAAWNVGVRASTDGRLGRLNVAADAYRVDDGNTVSTAMLRYQPALRLPFAVRPVTGFEHRKASFNTVDYWSPNEGYGLVYAGLEREWARGDRWQLNASVQRGWRVYGEAGSSWGAGLSGRVRIGKQWALGGNAWGVNNSRDNRPYRARSVTLFLEKRW